MSNRPLKMVGQEYARVRLAELQIDHEYQRTLDEKRAQKIGEQYVPALFGVVVVAQRNDGVYYVIDGQHRVAGLVMSGHQDMEIAVQVHRGLTQSEEAMMFYELNMGRGNVRAFDQFKARVVGREPIATTIVGILTDLRLRAVPSACKNGVSGVTALESVHQRFDNLVPTLTVLKCWSNAKNGDYMAYDKRLILYVGTFLAMFKQADTEVLTKKLIAYGAPANVIAEMLHEHETWKTESAKTCAIAVLLKIYNTRNRKPLRREDRGIDA